MKIFLVGYMGCGKSTKAKQMAAKLACGVVDLDAAITDRHTKSIAEIFAVQGEAGFRRIETVMLKNYPYPENCVIATGGGLPCFFDNMEWMNENGITIYLKMEPSQLVSRLGKREKRPLIAGMDDEQLLEFIKLKLEEREQFYNKAKLTVNAFDLDVEKLYQQLERLV